MYNIYIYIIQFSASLASSSILISFIKCFPILIQFPAAQRQGVTELLPPGITTAQGSRGCKGCVLVARRGVQGVNQPDIQRYPKIHVGKM